MIKSRLAPTPSGFLHRGNALNFLLTQEVVRRHNGRLLLRIDDIDRGRYRPEYVTDILISLEWLRIDYDEGPKTLGEFEQQWSQQHRASRYKEVLEQLRATAQLYACNLSRKQIKTLCPDGIYRGEARDKSLSLDTPGVAWRVEVPTDWSVNPTPGTDFNFSPPSTINLRQAMGDFVIRKKDGSAAYQLASLVDDEDFGIDTIVRGEDLLGSTAAQLYLAELLNFFHFRRSVTFYHHPLLTDDDGGKLSKSAGAASLKAMREAGLPAPTLADFSIARP